MMQNNPMGAMMPQGVAPAASTGLNFQSDPSMRAQFKGFMSGMQAKQPAPAAPMAPMMQQPLPMPPSMQNVDIFQPMPSSPMGFNDGGVALPEAPPSRDDARTMAIAQMSAIAAEKVRAAKQKAELAQLMREQEIIDRDVALERLKSDQQFDKTKRLIDTILSDSDYERRGLLKRKDGGPVPRSTNIAGQPHMLSYITPGEANVLQAMGGSGAPGPGGIPSFFFDFDGGDVTGRGQDVGYSDPYESPGTAGTTNFSSGDGTSSGADDYYTASQNPPPRSSNTVNFSTTTVPGGGSSDEGDPVMDALSQAIANTAKANQAEKNRSVADLNVRFDQIQGQDPTGVGSGPTAVGGMPETLTGAGRTVDTILDIDTTAPDLLSLGAFGGIGPDVNLEQFGGPGESLSNQVQSIYDTDPNYEENVGNPNFLSDAGRELVFTLEGSSLPENQQFNKDAAELAADEGEPISPLSGPPSLGFDLGGMGAEGEAVSLPGASLEEVQSAMDLSRAKGGDSTTIQSEIGRLSDLMGRETTVTRGDKKNIPGKVDPNTGLALNPDAKTVSSLEQLASRAGRGSQGISGLIENVTGFNPAKSMYEDIVNNGYSPIYDAQGQIIGTVNPETGQLGKGSRSIDTGALSESDSDLPAFIYNQFADRNLAGGGGDGNNINQIIKTANTAIQDKKAKEEPITEEDVAPTATTTAAQPGPRRTVAAQVGNPLGFGYGQISGLTPNLNSAADDFLRLLGGR